MQSSPVNVNDLTGTGKCEALYASIIGKNFGIIWKAFCAMQSFSKNLRADLLRMQGIISIFIIKTTQNLIFT